MSHEPTAGRRDVGMAARPLSEIEVAAGMGDLPERFADRLHPASLRSAQKVRNVGEWLLTAQGIVHALSRTGGGISHRERADLRRYVATFVGASVENGRVRSDVAALAHTLEALPTTVGPTGADVIELARRVAARFAPLVPESDRWELETDDEDDWALDAELLADAAAYLLLKHRILTDAEDRALLGALFDAYDMPRTRLGRLARRGSPLPDDSDRRHAAVLSEARTRGDGWKWVDLLDTARLYIPVAAPGMPWPVGLPAPDDPGHITAFTTAEAFTRVVGADVDGHLIRTGAELRTTLGHDVVLHLDPGLPTGAVVDVAELDDLQAGRAELVAPFRAIRRADPPSRGSGGVLSDPEEIARFDAEQQRLRELLTTDVPAPADDPDAPARSPVREPPRPNWWLDEFLPRAVFLFLGMSLAVLLPAPLGVYGPVLGAGASAVLAKLLGRSGVPLAMTVVAAVFAVIGTVVLLVI